MFWNQFWSQFLNGIFVLKHIIATKAPTPLLRMSFINALLWQLLRKWYKVLSNVVELGSGGRRVGGVSRHRRCSACGSARPGGSLQQRWISARGKLQSGSQISSRREASGWKWERNKAVSRLLSSRGEKEGTTSSPRRRQKVSPAKRPVNADSGSRIRGRKLPAIGCCRFQNRGAISRVSSLSRLAAGVFAPGQLTCLHVRLEPYYDPIRPQWVHSRQHPS